MNLKEILKKNDRLRRFVKCVKIKKDFKRDAKDFCGNYMEAKSEITQLEYSILLIVHSLEKGLSSKNYDAELLAQGIPAKQIRHYGFAFEGKKVLIGSL